MPQKWTNAPSAPDPEGASWCGGRAMPDLRLAGNENPRLRRRCFPYPDYSTYVNSFANKNPPPWTDLYELPLHPLLARQHARRRPPSFSPPRGELVGGTGLCQLPCHTFRHSSSVVRRPPIEASHLPLFMSNSPHPFPLNHRPVGISW
jgi:hypothetical protein